MDNYIELKKQRDFGDIITATFDFIKLNFKPLIELIFYYVGPVILISSVMSASWQTDFQQSIDPYNPSSVFVQLASPKYLLTLLLKLIAYTLLQGLTYGYVLLYAERKGQNIEISEVWAYAKDKFFLILGTSIVVGLLATVGFILFIIPGIYLTISLIPIFIVRLAEDKTIGEGISRSFSLIKGNWWFTLGLIAVLGVLMMIVIYAFYIPAGIIMGIMDFSDLSSFNSSSILYMILMTIGDFLSMVLYIVPVIATSILYFSLVEQKDSDSLFNMVDKINEEEDTL